MTRPKWGQHFLQDPNIVRKILQCASLGPTETVLEIGPGHGILTQALAKLAKEVISIELDRGLKDELTQNLKGYSNIKLIYADALTFPFQTLRANFKVVANLPYYISTPIIFHLLESRAQISKMVLMLQKEVAIRLSASPGSKNYSPLSIAAQFYTHPHMAFNVSRKCFKPIPKVDSAVVQLKVRQSPAVEVKDEAFFFRTVKGGFAHRRKVLRNSLRDSGFSSDVLIQAEEALSLDMNRRAETLSMKEFAQLSDILFELRS